ncbi:hypothetical protein HY483_02375 [Candidatus Woesearchaeota archaeon]|nr:hypothetical protein [Candidatus Woesearchaeota archaeon]
MSQVENHLKWCLRDKSRLIKVNPDITLAKRHLKKSEYNYGVLQHLEKTRNYDWALNVGFYSIYHCFLAILSKFGYESRNQSCTLGVILSLIDNGNISLDKDIVLQFDTLDVEKRAISSTIRMDREIATYGVDTSIDLKELNNVKDLIIKLQRETIKILAD